MGHRLGLANAEEVWMGMFRHSTAEDTLSYSGWWQSYEYPYTSEEHDPADEESGEDRLWFSSWSAHSLQCVTSGSFRFDRTDTAVAMAGLYAASRKACISELFL